MAKIRTIKPELFRHEALFEAECTSKLPLRLAFIGLFTCCDREGRFRWRPRTLKLDVFPYDDIDFAAVLEALLHYGFIKKYVIANEDYGCIPSWHKHQHINNRETPSHLPSPEADEATTWFSSEIDVASFSSDALTHSKKNDDLTVQQPDSTTNHRISSAENAVLEVFHFWQKMFNYPQARLDHKRKRCILEVLANGYTQAQLCQAIQGCALTPHNMGQNERGERYDGLHIIFKSDNIDRFIRNYHHPPANTCSAGSSPSTSKLKCENFDDKQYTQTPIDHISWMQSG